MWYPHNIHSGKWDENTIDRNNSETCSRTTLPRMHPPRHGSNCKRALVELLVIEWHLEQHQALTRSKTGQRWRSNPWQISVYPNGDPVQSGNWYACITFLLLVVPTHLFMALPLAFGVTRSYFLWRQTTKSTQWWAMILRIVMRHR